MAELPDSGKGRQAKPTKLRVRISRSVEYNVNYLYGLLAAKSLLPAFWSDLSTFRERYERPEIDRTYVGTM